MLSRIGFEGICGDVKCLGCLFCYRSEAGISLQGATVVVHLPYHLLVREGLHHCTIADKIVRKVVGGLKVKVGHVLAKIELGDLGVGFGRRSRLLPETLADLNSVPRRQVKVLCGAGRGKRVLGDQVRGRGLVSHNRETEGRDRDLASVGSDKKVAIADLVGRLVAGGGKKTASRGEAGDTWRICK